MDLPGGLRGELEAALEELRLGGRVESVRPLGGGCINNGARIDTDLGARFFLKWNARAPAGLFEAEADGLRALGAAGAAGAFRAPGAAGALRVAGAAGALRVAGAAGALRAPEAAGALKVPKPLAVGGGGEGPAWLLLEYVPPGAGDGAAWARMGSGLAAVHAAGRGPEFGWPRDNWIGSLPQANAPSASWGAFWRDRRLVPQLERARAGGFLPDRVLDRVVELAPSGLGDVTTPELLHGDLWSGNAYVSEAGEPVVVDPAVYEGHGEVDLAMADLFGGFPGAFWDAYRAARGVSAAFAAYRKDLYQLYYLLVHVNLFGTSYEAGCLAAARRVVGELGG